MARQGKPRKQNKKWWPKKIIRWNFNVHDKWFELAKKEGYRARSAYKLIQLDEKFGLIRPGMKVVDVACAPGSWLQVLSRRLWEHGLVVGFDIQPIKSLKKENVTTFVGDIFEKEKITETIWLHMNVVDLVTSDIAPKTTWHKDIDQYASVELNLAILDLAKDILRPGWTLVMKVFIWEDVWDLIWPVKKHFKKLHRYSPPAVRKRSFEEYFVCLNFLDQ